MDFLDSAVDKAKEVFDVAKKKTGEVVSTEKRKLDISIIKAKLDKDFIKLGKLCFEKLKEAEQLEGAEAELFDSISKKNAEIEKLSKEIEDIKEEKNDNKCASCGAVLAQKYSYCPHCGIKID